MSCFTLITMFWVFVSFSSSLFVTNLFHFSIKFPVHLTKQICIPFETVQQLNRSKIIFNNVREQQHSSIVHQVYDFDREMKCIRMRIIIIKIGCRVRLNDQKEGFSSKWTEMFQIYVQSSNLAYGEMFRKKSLYFTRWIASRMKFYAISLLKIRIWFQARIT